MSLRPVDAVEIICDGCGDALDYGGEYQFFLRDQVDNWLDECGWAEEDGKHYCQSTPTCWPPSHDEDE